MAAIARGSTVTVRDAALLLFMMAFTGAGLVQAQESSPEIQKEQTSQEEEAEREAEPAAADTLPPVEVLQEADTQPEPKPEAEPASEPQPARPRPITTTAVPKTRQATAQVQTAVPSPLQQPEPEGVERATAGGEPTAYSPVEGYVATRSATGTKTDTPLIETPQSISVIGVEQMQDQGVQTLDEAVRYTPGVFADGFGVDIRDDNVIIHGTEGSVFIDGLSTGIQGGIYQNTIPIEPYALERIEVLRGPSAMLYGATSAGGIVNGISKRPTLEPFAEAGIDYGSFDFRQLRGDLSGPLFENGDWYYRITGLGRLADTQVDYVDNDRWMLQPSIAYRPDGDTEVLLLGNFQRDDSGSTAQFFPLEGTLYPTAQGRKIPRDTFAGIPTDHYDTEQESGTLLIDKKLGSGIPHGYALHTHQERLRFDVSGWIDDQPAKHHQCAV